MEYKDETIIYCHFNNVIRRIELYNFPMAEYILYLNETNVMVSEFDITKNISYFDFSTPTNRNI